ncbi:MAG: NADPH-dependent F420 reductase [Woeseiaceae bacterium]
MLHTKFVTILAVTFIAFSGTAFADRIAVIGTGNVAGALGPEFAAQGHEIVYGSRNPDRSDVRALVARTGQNASATTQSAAIADADIVVLAVPGRLAASIAADLGDLTDKIIIDPTNNYIRDDVPRLATEMSNAEAIQAAAPGAHVVKAFNTLNWRHMVDPDSSGGPLTIPLVGNSAAAKAKVAVIVAGMGLEPIDLGPVQNARHVEGMLVLWMHARMHGNAFDYHLRKAAAE